MPLKPELVYRCPVCKSIFDAEDEALEDMRFCMAVKSFDALGISMHKDTIRKVYAYLDFDAMQRAVDEAEEATAKTPEPETEPKAGDDDPLPAE